MNVLPILDLAGAIVRFVTSAREIVSLDMEDIKSSTAVEYVQAELESRIWEISCAHEIARLATLIFESGKHPTPHEEALTRICEECYSIHQELEETIAEAQISEGGGRHKPPCATSKFVWTSGHHGLVALDKHLQELELQIDEHIPSYIRSQKEEIENWVEKLAETSRRLNINRSKELQRLVIDTNTAFRNLATSSNVSENVSDDHHRRRMPRSSTVGLGRPLGDILITFSSIAEQTKVFIAECHFKQSLISRGRDCCQRDIEEYAPSASERPRYPSSIRLPCPDHFNEWLENGRGIFWISEREETGKSALMEQFSHSIHTKNALLRWVGNSPFISVSYKSEYFRTTTQYPIHDLLRSICLQFIRQCLSILSASYPEEWTHLVEARGGRFGHVTFRREDLVLALELICQVKDSNAKFCFFIEGLDRFEGFETEIASLLKKRCSSRSIKMCLRTRPNNTIGVALKNESTQCYFLPDLTDGRICHYITKKLDEDPWIAQRENFASNWKAEVFEYLRRESAGSFTWIDMVFSRVLSAMKPLDDMYDFLGELKRLPIDLQELLFHILNDVPEEVHDQQARILLLASQAREPLSILAISFLDKSSDSVLGGAAVPMGQQEIDRRCRSTKERVSIWCGCLVDIIPSSGSNSEELVAWSHNSIRNYLRSTEARKILTQRLKSSFDPQREVCNVLLARIKFHKVSPAWEEGGPIHGLVFQFLQEAKIYELATKDVLGAQINELETIVHSRKGQTFWWWQKRSIEKGESTSTFLELMIQHQLVGYLWWRFRNFPRLIPRSLEMANLLESSLIRPAEIRMRSELVRVFLDHGADPNFSSDHGYHLDTKPTPWRLFLLHLVHSAQKVYTVQFESDQEHFLALEYLINAGADLETPVHPTSKSGYSTSVATLSVEDVICMVTSQENASDLCDLIEQKRKRHTGSISGWLRWR
ncbi:hypothetical protein BKA65DRAFT_102513 [Rhexocercosporidium sp. MPI-PUGE-AT-0058]|nr:hypothetical protein BKA65DRAFT_102513 [Rhexocercosporidium sp. MPI-PUGE-AT-0058]